MCFCFPKQNKIFDFVSASKNIFRFLFLQLNISLGLFPQVKITKTKNTFTSKLKVLLLAETKSKILFCLGKQKIFSLAWENKSRYCFSCGNKVIDFYLLGKTKIDKL